MPRASLSSLATRTYLTTIPSWFVSPGSKRLLGNPSSAPPSTLTTMTLHQPRLLAVLLSTCTPSLPCREATTALKHSRQCPVSILMLQASLMAIGSPTTLVLLQTTMSLMPQSRVRGEQRAITLLVLTLASTIFSTAIGASVPSSKARFVISSRLSPLVSCPLRNPSGCRMFAY